MSFDVFVSYRRLDAEPVRALVAELRKLHVRVWIDEANIEEFTSTTSAIHEGIASSTAFVAYYSRMYPQSRVCQWELAQAYVAARCAGDPRDRVYVVNPEADNSHIQPLELRDANYARPAERSMADIARAIAKRIRMLRGQKLGELHARTQVEWHGRLPRRSTRFVGRTNELWEIHTGLHAGEAAGVMAPRIPVVQLCGLPGVGKTLLAEEYAARFESAFPGGVFWLRAPGPSAADQAISSPQREAILLEQLSQLASELGARPQKTDVRSTRQALARQITVRMGSLPHLWVVDDLPHGVSLDELETWVAPHPAGKTLITTRSRVHESYGTLLDLDVLDPSSALDLLRSRFRHAVVDDLEQARLLVAELGFHPLAIEVAAAELWTRRGTTSTKAYRERLQRVDKDALELAAKLAGELPTGHEASIASTILRSFADLGEEGRDVLRLASQLAVAPIPSSLISSVFRHLASDAETGEEAALLGIQQCEASSLATRVDDGAVRVHALVSRTVRFRDALRERHDALRAAVLARLNSILPASEDPRVHAQLALPVAHARHLIATHPFDEALIETARWLARFDFERGSYESAAELSQTEAAACARLFGEDSPRTLLALGDLARALAQLQRPLESRELHRKVLEARRRALGPTHPDTLTALNNLATTLQSQAELAEAAELHAQILDHRMKVLGPEHPHTLFSANNLGGVLDELGRTDEARQLLERAVAGRARVLGVDHPDTLTSMQNLALVCFRMGDVERAIELSEATLAVRTRVHGDEHWRTLNSVTSLAGMLIAKGDLERASSLLVPALQRAQQHLGRHPTTYLLANNLGKTRLRQHAYLEARHLFEQAIEGQRELGGRPDLVARYATNLYDALLRLGDRERADEVFARELRAIVDSPETLGVEGVKLRAEVLALTRRAPSETV